MNEDKIPELRDKVVKGMVSLIAHLQIYYAADGAVDEPTPATPESMKKWFEIALKDGVLKQ